MGWILDSVKCTGVTRCLDCWRAAGRSSENVSQSLDVFLWLYIIISVYTTLLLIFLHPIAPKLKQMHHGVGRDDLSSRIWKKKIGQSFCECVSKFTCFLKIYSVKFFFPGSVKRTKDRLSTKEKIKIVHLFSRVKVYLFSKRENVLLSYLNKLIKTCCDLNMLGERGLPRFILFSSLDF